MVFAGEEYGTGSSRDWAAKGTQLLGVQGRGRAQLRAHPPLATSSAWACCRCSSRAATASQTLGLDGNETFDIDGLDGEHHAAAGRDAGRSTAPTARRSEVPVMLRIDTPIEVDYYKHGGILPFVLRQLLAA